MVILATKPAVLLVQLSKRFGGADVRVLDTARAMEGKRPYAVAVLEGSPLHQKLKEEGLPALPLPYARPDPRHLLALGQFMRHYGFQIVDAHNPQSQLWGLWAARRARLPALLATVHTVYRVAHGGPVRGRLHEVALRLGRRWGCHFVAVSQSIVDYLLELGVPAGRITLSYNGMQQPALPVAGRAAVRREFGWGEEQFVLIMVARLEAVKAHPILLQAIEQLLPHFPQLRCLLVGEGRARAALQAEVAARGLEQAVVFAGFRRDVPALLAASDLFCLATYAEGLPYAVLEAAGQGLPLLLSTVDGMAEHFQAGVTARMVPPGDVAALREELRYCLTHPRELAALALAGRRLVSQRFDPEKMARDTLAAYDQAMQEGVQRARRQRQRL